GILRIEPILHNTQWPGKNTEPDPVPYSHGISVMNKKLAEDESSMSR
ncbi:hypothetical protein FOMG_19342, partial [Fusarium oxysporum f. sp. melonis 26406]